MATKTLPVRGGSQGKTLLDKSKGTPIKHSCYTYEGTDLESIRPTTPRWLSGLKNKKPTNFKVCNSEER